MLTTLLTATTLLAAPDTTVTGTARDLDVVTIKGSSRARRTGGAENTLRIGQDEMFRAACCNLGESFVTNPSVDVSYDDAATGASQIKLLGLSGLYVQMLTETMPAFRGAAQPFALGYVPGTWMKSINVSKGASSVKNGYESITGQIDIDYLKPDDERKTNVDLYLDDGAAFEANANTNVHINDRLSTNVLLHYQNEWTCRDDNGDGFQDMPRVIQYNVMNRWKYRSPRYIMHAGLHVINENRTGGQMEDATTTPRHAATAAPFPAVDGGALPRFRLGIDTERYEGYMKHAFIVDPERSGNVAFMANASWHNLSAEYGGYDNPDAPLNKCYAVKQLNVNTQLMYETQFTERHQLSTGLSLVHDHLDQRYHGTESETVPGAYAQYTYTLDRTFTLMAGLRYDYSNYHEEGFVTPRMHLKWSPASWLTLRASSGLGYRSPHPWAENHNLLASGRMLVVVPDGHYADIPLSPAMQAGASSHLDLEKAWNSGLSAAFTIPCGPRSLHLNAEYYYTNFFQQTVVDYEHTKGMIVIHNLRDTNASYSAHGYDVPKSYSHVFQVDANYELLPGLDVTAAYRHNIVRCTYGNTGAIIATGKPFGGYALREKILTPRFKGLVSLCYQTPLKLWQFDVTIAVNGPGRLPDSAYNPAAAPAGPTTFGAMESLSAQVTRRFRYCDVFVGGENLTNRMQYDAVRGGDTPWSRAFEPTLVYGSPSGYMLYSGVRFKL